jgi:hypothetical protein
MDIQELKTLLANTEVDEAIKAQAIQLFEGGKKAEAFKLIENALDQSLAKLDAENPEAAAEYTAAEKEYSDSITTAKKEFDAEMTGIEAEAKKLEEEVGQDLAAARAAELQESIQNA